MADRQPRGAGAKGKGVGKLKEFINFIGQTGYAGDFGRGSLRNIAVPAAAAKDVWIIAELTDMLRSTSKDVAPKVGGRAAGGALGSAALLTQVGPNPAVRPELQERHAQQHAAGARNPVDLVGRVPFLRKFGGGLYDIMSGQGGQGQVQQRTNQRDQQLRQIMGGS